MKETAYSSCGVVFYITGHFPCVWEKGGEKGVIEGLATGTGIGIGIVQNLGFT